MTKRAVPDLDSRWRAELLRRAAEDWPHSDEDQHLAVAAEYEKMTWALTLKVSMAWDDLKQAVRDVFRRWLQ